MAPSFRKPRLGSLQILVRSRLAMFFRLADPATFGWGQSKLILHQTNSTSCQERLISHTRSMQYIPPTLMTRF